MEIRSRDRPAGDEQRPTGVLHSDGFESLQCEKNTDTQMGIRMFWQRVRDSNPRKRSQSPVCYRYTNPLFFVTESHMVETTGLEPVTSCV